MSLAEESWARLRALPLPVVRDALVLCCGSSRWVAAMLERWPLPSRDAVLDAADRIWGELTEPDYLEAFSHHPKIGGDVAELARKFKASAELSRAEQASVEQASRDTLLQLRDANVEYEQRHGFIFIVCATGKTAAEMLGLLQARLGNDRAVELLTAAQEQAKITKLRLQKWMT